MLNQEIPDLTAAREDKRWAQRQHEIMALADHLNQFVFSLSSEIRRTPLSFDLEKADFSDAVMVRSVAAKLFGYVYSDVSAVLFLNDRLQFLDYRLFDSDFGGSALLQPVPPGAAWCVLIVNHPTGVMHLTEVDERNIALLRNMNIGVEAYVACESACVKEV